MLGCLLSFFQDRKSLLRSSKDLIAGIWEIQQTLLQKEPFRASVKCKKENQALIGPLKVVSFCSAKQTLESKAVPSRMTP